jgi:hypothetical protein
LNTSDVNILSAADENMSGPPKQAKLDGYLGVQEKTDKSKKRSYKEYETRREGRKFQVYS